MINAAGRDIPEYIEGYGKTVPYQGAFAMSGRPTAIVQASRPKSAVRGESKLWPPSTRSSISWIFTTG